MPAETNDGSQPEMWFRSTPIGCRRRFSSHYAEKSFTRQRNGRRAANLQTRSPRGLPCAVIGCPGQTGQASAAA